jgi:hypothetical protein
MYLILFNQTIVFTQTKYIMIVLLYTVRFAIIN